MDFEERLRLFAIACRGGSNAATVRTRGQHMARFQGPLKQTKTFDQGKAARTGVMSWYYSEWETETDNGRFFIIETPGGEIRAGFQPKKVEPPKPDKQEGDPTTT